MYEELLKIYLGFWRGSGAKPANLRRYNIDAGDYNVRPLYVNKVLHAIATQRAVHTGESLSRMLDFAIRNYVPRLLESLLAGNRWISPEKRQIWAEKHSRRRRRNLYFITYKSETQENSGANLCWLQNSQFIPKNTLSPPEILYHLRYAA